MFGFNVEMELEDQETIERIREQLMRQRGRVVTDLEVLRASIGSFVFEDKDPQRDAERRLACENAETPPWLRREVLARDGTAACTAGTAASCTPTTSCSATQVGGRPPGISRRPAWAATA
jgi:hypothetical protein